MKGRAEERTGGRASGPADGRTLEVTGGKYMFEVPVGRERKKLYELSKYPQSNAKATIRNAFEC